MKTKDGSTNNIWNQIFIRLAKGVFMLVCLENRTVAYNFKIV